MVRKVYIGKPSAHVGKTAFQILANLKNFGIGRMLTRHEFDKFPEPSFHIVKRVETRMDPELKYGTIWCETVIRGQRLPGIRPLTVTYRPDFRLIPRDEENDFIGNFKIINLGERKNVLPRNYRLPPLMNEWMIRYQQKQHNLTNNSKAKEFKIPFVYQDRKDLRKPDSDLFWIENRLAESDDEPTTVEFDGQYHFNEEYLEYCQK